MLLNICMIALGSSIGGVLRWLISQALQKYAWYQFPLGTFVVNVIGCFCIGLFYALFEKYSIGNQSIRLFLTVGFCGSFTTFSTFINENMTLFQNGNTLTALIYLVASVSIGMICLYGGMMLGKN